MDTECTTGATKLGDCTNILEATTATKITHEPQVGDCDRSFDSIGDVIITVAKDWGLGSILETENVEIPVYMEFQVPGFKGGRRNVTIT